MIRLSLSLSCSLGIGRFRPCDVLFFAGTTVAPQYGLWPQSSLVSPRLKPDCRHQTGPPRFAGQCDTCQHMSRTSCATRSVLYMDPLFVLRPFVLFSLYRCLARSVYIPSFPASAKHRIRLLFPPSFCSHISYLLPLIMPVKNQLVELEPCWPSRSVCHV